MRSQPSRRGGPTSRLDLRGKANFRPSALEKRRGPAGPALALLR